MTTPTNTQPGNGTGGAFGFVREGYDRVEPHELKASDIEGATVYGRSDENMGTINALTLGTDGKITDAIIDVGGFLGIGAHSVELAFSRLNIQRETGGHSVRVNLDTTKEQLKAMPQHTA